jgi:hypothetical protein
VEWSEGVGLVTGDDHKTAYDGYKEPDRVYTWSDLRAGLWDYWGRPPLGGWGIWCSLILAAVVLGNASWKSLIWLVAAAAAGLGAAALLWWRNRSGKDSISLHGSDMKGRH